MFPAVIDFAEHGSDPCTWTARHAAELAQTLLESGAILFRHTGIESPRQFEALARLTCSEFPHFKEESSPRHVIEGAVQTSTDYPNQYPIQFHSEYSYASRWPMKLYFCCLVPPDRGGETPISSTRAVLAGMSPATRALFERKGVLYLRNYRPYVGVAWQKAFMTSDRATVERQCGEIGIQCEWRPDGVLRTRQHAAAIVPHPVTGESVWFNHGFIFNAHAIEPKAMRERLTAFPEDDPLSANTLFGDGTPIPPETIEEIRSLYERASIRNAWERGDVLLIDNMLTSHARAPYSGRRSIAVLMADACSRDTLRT